MKKHIATLFRLALVLVAAAPTFADERNLPFVIGERHEGGGYYSVSSSGERASNLQKVQLLLEEKALSSDRAVTTTTSKVIIQTGKTKTVDQLVKVLAEALQRFLAKNPADEGKSLAKIGSLKAGGEVELLVQSGELTFEFRQPEQTSELAKLTPAQATVMLALLQGR